MSKHFTLRLCDNVAQAIDERAAAEGRTRSSMINQILERALFREAAEKRTLDLLAAKLHTGAAPASSIFSAAEIFHGPGIANFIEPKPEVLKKVRMCHKHNHPADSCSGMSCKQDRQAKLDRFSC